MSAAAHAARQHDAHPSAVLYVTYFASALETGRRSGTYRKLEAIVKDFDRSGGADAPCARRRRGQCGGGYRLFLLYQRHKKERLLEPFNCTLHAPLGAECYEYTREQMKRTFTHELALHRRGDAPRRLNVGFWVCALWLVEQERAGRRYPFVWYLEDDVYLPGSWSSFMRRYDTANASVDLLVVQAPYLVEVAANRGDEKAFSDGGWARPKLGTLTPELAILRGTQASSFTASGRAGAPTGAEPTQLSIPTPTLKKKLPVLRDADYAKAPLYVWRMRRRLVTEVARALLRGARAHEEFFVPTVCNVMLRDPPCRWAPFDVADVGVPCGSNLQDAWYQANRPELLPRTRAAGVANLTDFRGFVSDLQQPGGYKLLPAAPPRLHHPVKGQLRGTQNALTIRENGGV